jgi:hypothetical protein
MDDDLSVAKFPRPPAHRRASAPPEEAGIILECGGHLRKKWARNAARARIVDRERWARLRGVEIIRPELHVVESREEPTTPRA